MKLTLLGKQENAHEDGIWSAAWAPSSADTPAGLLVTGSVDESVKLWQVSGQSLSGMIREYFEKACAFLGVII
jgi:WD40 repeat protein